MSDMLEVLFVVDVTGVFASLFSWSIILSLIKDVGVMQTVILVAGCMIDKVRRSYFMKAKFLKMAKLLEKIKLVK